MRRQTGAAAAAGLLVGLALLTWWLAPRVVAWGPPGAEIPATAALELELNTAVEIASARSHLAISPAVNGQVTMEGTTLRFEPARPLPTGQTFTVTLRAGVRAANGLPALTSSQRVFRVGLPRLLFLRDVDGVSNVWQARPGQQADQLTDLARGVWGFSVAGDGLLLAGQDRQDGDDLLLWQAGETLQTVLDCRGWHCRQAVWQPGGPLVAYERWPLSEAFAEVQVWLLDTTTGVSRPALAGTGVEALAEVGLGSHSPRWSADGRYLALVQPANRLLVVLDSAGGEPTVIPAEVQAMGGWAPSGPQLAYTELAFGRRSAHTHVDEDGQVIRHDGTGLYSHAVVTDLSNGASSDLSEGLEADDGPPTWGPQGERLAVSRTLTGSGRQIWLLSRAGEARAVTDDPFVQHTALTWSPDGRYLAYMRLDMARSAAQPGIWVYDLQRGRETEVAASGFLPAWRP